MDKEEISFERKPKPNEQKIIATFRVDIGLFLATISNRLNSASVKTFALPSRAILSLILPDL